MTEKINTQVFTEDETAFDLKYEILKYLRYWPWFLIATIITLVISFIYLRYTPNVYQTTAKIKVLDESKGLELPSSAFIFNRSKINVENDIEILTSYRILQRVVNALELTSSFYSQGHVQTIQTAKLPFYYKQVIAVDSIQNTYAYEVSVTEHGFNITNLSTDKAYTINGFDSAVHTEAFPFHIKIDTNFEARQLVNKTYKITIRPLKQTILELKAKIAIEPIGDMSDLLKLTMNGVSTEHSERILNKIIDVFNNDGINDRQLVSKRTLDFVDERFIYLAEELDSIELNKKEFKQDNDLIYLETDTDLSLTQRTQAEQEEFRVENQLAVANLVNDALSQTNTAELLPANLGIDNSQINSLISEYNSVVLKREKLISSAGANNPSVVLANANLDELKQNITSSLQNYTAQLELTKRQLSTRTSLYKSKVAQLPLKEKLLRAIERQQKIKESLYLFLLQKREEAAINLAITEPSLKVVEHALSSSQPIAPKSRIIYAAAVLLGLLIPFGVLYVVFLFDTKLHGKRDVELINPNVPVVGEIPLIKKGIHNIFNDPNDRSALAESYRILSSNINYLLKPSGYGNIIFCTSTIKGEGKTFMSLNLSLALASLNKKVLLIGADIRNPQLHSYFNIDKNSDGLTNYLHDPAADWKDFTLNGFENYANHDTLISGSLPPNPAVLLTNGRFEVLLSEAREVYDYIIVDTAPTILVTDTLLISHLADVTVYVSRANFTEKKLLEYSVELYKQKKLKNMAYVINGVGSNKSYGYNYGYDYGYGS